MQTSSFLQISKMNEAFGNPKGDPNHILITPLVNQCENIGHEYEELQLALAVQDPIAVVDALCDIIVFCGGAFHLMGIDADKSLAAVYESNMSKFCSDQDVLERTQKKYTDLGVPFAVHGEFPAKYLKATASCEDKLGNKYASGKFLKSVSYQEPQLTLA